jgi:hypothetical protein
MRDLYGAEGAYISHGFAVTLLGVGQVTEQNPTGLRLELINDLAYSQKSHQQIAETHGLSLEGIEQFTSTWSHLIDMARWDRYMHLKHLQLMAEVKEVLRVVAREKELNAKILAQKASGKSGQANGSTRSRSPTYRVLQNETVGTV